MLKYDCKYFPGDRPCVYNKKEGITCNTCIHYSPVKQKILIIKLDAIGDVLRTTTILKPIRKKYPYSYITWLTRENAKDLFINNVFVDEVSCINFESPFKLSTEKYDLVINLENSRISASIASYTTGKSVIGFILDEKGFVKPTSPEADYWLHLSAFDNLKIKNTRSHQEIMYSIVGLDLPIEKPVLNLPNDDAHTTEFVKNKFNINSSKTVIGLNTGVGSKWPNKGWAT